MIDFIRRLLGIPPVLPNGYPDMAANHVYVDAEGDIIRDVTRRINGGRPIYYNPPPPPPIPQVKEKPDPPMIAKIIDKVTKPSPRQHPSSTSTLSTQFASHHWCGSTFNDITKEVNDEDKKDPLILDHLPLKHFLMKIFPWILDVTEVRIRPHSGTMGYSRSAIVYGPLEIHITVSAVHHSELMVPSIEKKVRERLYVDLIPLISSIYVNNKDERPIIIFSPEHSETILEYVK